MWDMVQTKSNSKRFYRKETSPIRIVAMRLLLVVVLILIVAIIFWFYGESHLHDSHANSEFSFIDSLYFTIVTVTTLGYGDIVPVSESARMFDAFIITPVRIVVWVLFIGTAYQLVVQNNWERFRMNRAMKKLNGHVIIAGFGTTGAAAVEELILNKYDENNLVVIDNNEAQVKTAADAGATGIVGDPTREESLNNAGISGAKVLIVATHQDDTNVLITLTAKDLNPKIKVIARVSQQENIKQLRRAGADLIISPSRFFRLTQNI